MDLGEGVATMKEFLSYNNIPFNSGRVMNDFHVSYFVGEQLKFERNMQVLFDFIHTDFTRNILLSDNDLDSVKYYIEFTSKYQDYTFNEEENLFIINSKGDNKHGKPYRITISV